MDVLERIAAGLADSVRELEAGGPRGTSELWLFARAYSRLRHRAHSSRERRKLGALKVHCVRSALASDPSRFLVVVDPGLSHLWLGYDRAERNLLHVPRSVDLGVFAD